MQTAISFVLDGNLVTLDFNSNSQLSPTTTVLNFLRSLPHHKGVKEGCAEGDCGACTVVIGELINGEKLHYKSIDSCLLFLPSLHEKLLVTIENLKDPNGQLHPLQSAMVEIGGSQCGFCTPGIVMSMFSLYKNYDHPTREQIDDALTGNLCRCTGYRPIIEAAANACVYNGMDHFSQQESRIIELLKSIPHQTVRVCTKTQEYFRPTTLKEAVEFKHHNPDAIVISGSTDVALRVTKDHEVLHQILDLSSIDELQKIESTASGINIGSGVNLNEIARFIEQDFPALHSMLTVFGSQQIRNVATLGGNLGTASPISDTLSALMVYKAKVLLQSKNGSREVDLDSYILGYRRTVRRSEELITAVILPRSPHTAIIKSYKVSKRKDLDISTVSASFRLELNDGDTVQNIKLVYGGLAECTKCATVAEQFLVGKYWNRETVEEAMHFIDHDFIPISDTRASAEFRKVIAKNLLLKFWSETTNNE